MAKWLPMVGTGPVEVDWWRLFLTYTTKDAHDSTWSRAIAVNEWRARIALTFISKECVFYIPNTRETIKPKIWDCIQTRRVWRWATYIMHELCGVTTCNYDSLNWKQILFGERIPKTYNKWFTFGTSLGVSLFGLFGSNAMTKCSTLNNGVSLGSNTGFGTNSSSTPKRHGNGWLTKSRFIGPMRRPCSEGFDKPWGTRNVLCRRHNL